MRPDALWVITLLAALHSLAGTFHSLAAAWINMMRGGGAALADIFVRLWRMPWLAAGREIAPDPLAGEILARGWEIRLLPSTSRIPALRPPAWARPVSVPWPISERATRMINGVVRA